MWNEEERKRLLKHSTNSLVNILDQLKEEIEYCNLENSEIDLFLQDMFSYIFKKYNLEIDDNVLKLITKYLTKRLKNN